MKHYLLENTKYPYLWINPIEKTQYYDIALNAMNIPAGSVSVTAGGAALTENVDYTVDYNLGRVKIINDGIKETGKILGGLKR
jgi:cell surface protein SprA